MPWFWVHAALEMFVWSEKTIGFDVGIEPVMQIREHASRSSLLGHELVLQQSILRAYGRPGLLINAGTSRLNHLDACG
jgi:hypothetical protein